MYIKINSIPTPSGSKEKLPQFVWFREEWLPVDLASSQLCPAPDSPEKTIAHGSEQHRSAGRPAAARE